MNRPPLLVACLLVLSFSCSKHSSDINLQSGLLVYLPFNGNMNDMSGNGNLTTPVGGARLVSGKNGGTDSAFGGTGNGERLLVTNNGSIKFTDFSISVNVLLNRLQNQAFLAMLDNTDAEGVSFGFGMGLPGLSNIEIALTNSAYNCSDLVTSSNSVTDTSQYIPQTATWYNMITTFHNGEVKIYVNGQLVSSASTGIATVPICPSAKLVVGGWWDGGTESINGDLDEVRLYDRVLNADEIANLSNNFQ